MFLLRRRFDLADPKEREAYEAARASRARGSEGSSPDPDPVPPVPSHIRLAGSDAPWDAGWPQVAHVRDQGLPPAFPGEDQDSRRP